MPALETKYVPADHEPRIQERWERARAFHADPSRVLSGEREPYCILLPPPNVTARLHLGHAFSDTMQDILVRAHRMKGYETLWMPGTDHAGIATQTVVDKRLKASGEPSLIDYKRDEAEGRNGRERFVAKVQAWKDDYEAQIVDQLKAFGCSLDWERQRFTMDEICAHAVREAFFRLFKEGLIYRGKRLVNWDPVTQTALADDEVEMEEIQGSFSYMRYPLRHTSGPAEGQPVTWSELYAAGYPRALAPDGAGTGDDDPAFVTVATTRPETYLGDTGVAVHPDDPRAGALEGMAAEIPLVGRRVPIVKDDYVVMPDFVTGEESRDPKAKMATGFLKVTPAHDPNDWEIGRRHALDVINVMAPDATISDAHGWHDVGDAHVFVGLSREDAREKVLDEFKARALLEKRVAYTHAVGHSYRSHVPIEPYLSDQWYCKVSDDRLVGSAQRALDPNQRTTDTYLAPNDTRDGGTGVPPVRTTTGRLEKRERNLPHWEQDGKTYFITFNTDSTELNADERAIVLDTCRHWHERRLLLRAIVVMPDHCHMLVTPLGKPDGERYALDELMHSIKSFSAHEIRKRRGDSGSVWQSEYYDRIVRDRDEYEEKLRYIAENPVKEGLADRTGSYEFYLRNDDDSTDRPHGRDARATAGTANQDGALRFFPARYAKTYESWHDGLRDWCISRQLWWGHRIPVWTAPGEANPTIPELDEAIATVARTDHEARVCLLEEDSASIERLEAHGFRQDPDVLDTWFSSALWPLSTMGWPEAGDLRVTARQIDPSHASAIGEVWVKRVGTFKDFIGNAEDESGELIDRLLHLRDHATTADDGRPLAYQLFSETDLRAHGDDARALTEADEIQRATDLVCAVGVKEDAPVESTKFGAIHIASLLIRHGFRNTSGLLGAFNPTTVLCTGRDIITLWVSRMVMFNRHFKNGDLPFRDVYINPIVQDGHGQRMSKSLGNGVDPLDIVHSHGADALRLVLCQIATSTQDVRMPVDTVCPHTGAVFEPATTTTPNGSVVAAPIQSCPSDPSKKMVTAYGVASGLATPTDEMPLARNTSSRFDVGRNICTKLWNAARFAMLTLEEAETRSDAPVSYDELSLVDRWMLGRLSKAVSAIDEAIATYQFSRYAELVYDLLWRDFCDWYLEAIKPTVRTNPAQQAVLHGALDVILRVLHPIIPFVTEVLHEHLRELPATGSVASLGLEEAALLCTGAWPRPDAGLFDASADAQWERVQRLVEAIRQARAAQQIASRQRLTLHAPRAIIELVEASGPVVPHRAGLERVTSDDPDSSSVEILHEGATLRLSGLDEGVDPEKLRAQLADRKKKLTGEIGGLTGRLNNPGYVQKAPAHLVEETRAQLAAKEAELAEINDRLEDIA